MAPPPPLPPPPHSGDPSEPRSGNGVFTPDMLSEVRKFMDAGGYEGMKRRILEEGELFPYHPVLYLASRECHGNVVTNTR